MEELNAIPKKLKRRTRYIICLTKVLFMSQKEIKRSLVNFYLIRGFVAEMATGCLRKIEKINICIKLTEMKF